MASSSLHDPGCSSAVGESSPASADMAVSTASDTDTVRTEDSVSDDVVPASSNAEVADQLDSLTDAKSAPAASSPSGSSRKRKLQRPQKAQRLSSQSTTRTECNGYGDFMADQSNAFPDREDGHVVSAFSPLSPNGLPQSPEKTHNKTRSPSGPTSSATVPTRPASSRIRKPPKMFSKEMDEMFSIAAQKKRKKAEVVSAVEYGQQVTTGVVSQAEEAQIVVHTFSGDECLTDHQAAKPGENLQPVLQKTFVVVDSQGSLHDSSPDFASHLLPGNHSDDSSSEQRGDDTPEKASSRTMEMCCPTDDSTQVQSLSQELSSSDSQSADGRISPKKKVHRKNQWTVPNAPIKTPSSSLSKPESALVVAQENISYGDLIWGKIRGYDWWPGLVVSSSHAGQVTSVPQESQVPGQHGWVRWFGENQCSSIVYSRVAMFHNFRPLLLTNKKPKNVYRKALIEALEVAAARAKKDVPDEWLAGSRASRSKTSITEKDEQLIDTFCETPRQCHLLLWALGGFEPKGAEGLQPSEEEQREYSMDFSFSQPPPATASPVSCTPVQSYQRVHVVSPSPASLAARNTVPRPTQEMINSDSRPGSRQQLERFASVRRGEQALGALCICCGETNNIVQEHPLVVGGMCSACVPKFIECAYCFDEDGSQTFCTICADGKEVYLCDSPGCARAYCPLCLEKLCGAEIHQHINKADSWLCFMCQPEQDSDLLCIQQEWHSRLIRLMAADNCYEYEREPPPVPPPLQERRPLRVLALFDGIGTGMLVLRELGLEVEKYISSEIDPDAVRVARRHHPDIVHVGDVQGITRRHIAEWGPFDLVFGGSPCNDLSLANPARRGIYEGTGRLFFDFHRLVELARPGPEDKRPFFWLYENVVSMRIVDKVTISRFLECNPTVVDAKDVSPAHRPRFFWGNLPGMDRTIVPWPGDALVLQDCLEPHCNRQAKFTKLRTITTKSNSIRQTKHHHFPIHVEGGADGEGGNEDGLWCTEMERIFGFPPHYTDIGNMSRMSRQRLLGRAWSVPVVRHLLAPLKDYFKVASH